MGWSRVVFASQERTESGLWIKMLLQRDPPDKVAGIVLDIRLQNLR